MKNSIMLLLIGLFTIFSCYTVAKAQSTDPPKVGILVPQTGPRSLSESFGVNVSDLVETVASAFSARGYAVEPKLADTIGQQDKAIYGYEMLIFGEQVDIVLGPLWPGPITAIADKFQEKPTFAIGSLLNEEQEDVVKGNPLMLAFGSIPKSQIELIEKRFQDDDFPQDGRVFLLGASGLTDVLEAALPSDAMIERIDQARIDVTEAFKAARFVTGIGVDRSVGFLRKMLLENEIKAETVLFAPPSVKTAVTLAARLAARAWAKSGGDRDSFMQKLRDTARFDPERGTMELYWSVTALNSASITLDRNKDANSENRKRQGEAESDSTSTATKTCSCRNADGELVHCRDCASDSQCDIDPNWNETNLCSAECS